jgi:hypothetical protein
MEQGNQHSLPTYSMMPGTAVEVLEVSAFNFPCGRASESHLKLGSKQTRLPFFLSKLEDGIESFYIVPEVVCLAGLRGDGGL